MTDLTTTQTCSCVSSTTATATMRRTHAARRWLSEPIRKASQFATCSSFDLTSDLHLHQGCHAAGLKQEVVTALRTLRDKLLAEEKKKEVRRGEAHSEKSEGGKNVCVCVAASGQQQHRCQTETSGELGAARVFSGTAQQFESIPSTGRAQCVHTHTHMLTSPIILSYWPVLWYFPTLLTWNSAFLSENPPRFCSFLFSLCKNLTSREIFLLHNCCIKAVWSPGATL